MLNISLWDFQPKISSNEKQISRTVFLKPFLPLLRKMILLLTRWSLLFPLSAWWPYWIVVSALYHLWPRWSSARFDSSTCTGVVRMHDASPPLPTPLIISAHGVRLISKVRRSSFGDITHGYGLGFIRSAIALKAGVVFGSRSCSFRSSSANDESGFKILKMCFSR